MRGASYTLDEMGGAENIKTRLLGSRLRPNTSEFQCRGKKKTFFLASNFIKSQYGSEALVFFLLNFNAKTYLTLHNFSRFCRTMYYYVGLDMTIYHYVWLCMSTVEWIKQGHIWRSFPWPWNQLFWNSGHGGHFFFLQRVAYN